MAVIIHGIDIPKKHYMNGYYISDDGKVFDVSRKNVVGKAVPIPSEEPEPHWIPCSERLPDKNCRCLTTNDAWGAFEVDWNAWINGQWLYPNEKPVAWMPLPEPWKGE